MRFDFRSLIGALLSTLLVTMTWGRGMANEHVRHVGLRPEQIVVSLSIDSTSLEIQREALRLLTSIHLYGESLNQAHISICINHDVDDESNQEEIEGKTHFLVKQIHELGFEKLTIRYSQSLPYPTFALSLNKMCAFDPPQIKKEEEEEEEGGGENDEVMYFLYLDADVFVAHDPLPLLATHLPLHRGEGEGGDDHSVLLW